MNNRADFANSRFLVAVLVAILVALFRVSAEFRQASFFRRARNMCLIRLAGTGQILSFIEKNRD